MFKSIVILVFIAFTALLGFSALRSIDTAVAQRTAVIDSLLEVK